MYDYSKLTLRSYDYDPSVDLHKVDPTGEVNLRKAYAHGAIDGAVSFEEGAFNGVQDPDVLLPRPKDQFERIRQAEYVKESLRAAKADAEAGHSEGA